MGAFLRYDVVAVAATLGASHTALGCAAPQEMMRFKVRLPNTARAIRLGKPPVIVAIGSSSTEGVDVVLMDPQFAPRVIARPMPHMIQRLCH